MSTITSQNLDSLEPLDHDWVQKRLAEPPFVQIDGVSNARTLGSYPVVRKDANFEVQEMTRPKQIYRSGEISGITEKGKEQLKGLNIKKVFDLRSDTEMLKYNTPIPVIDGVVVEHVPVFKTEDYSPEVMAGRYALYARADTEAFMELYSQMLDNGGPSFSSVLKHVRDKPEDGLLFHCTAGKDRTAVIAAILLSLAGVDDDIIADDYSLTRIGREPDRDKILKRLNKEPIFADNKDAALNMLTSKRETMFAFLNLLKDKYGGVEDYVRRYCDLSPADVARIRDNLVQPICANAD